MKHLGAKVKKTVKDTKRKLKLSKYSESPDEEDELMDSASIPQNPKHTNKKLNKIKLESNEQEISWGIIKPNTHSIDLVDMDVIGEAQAFKQFDQLWEASDEDLEVLRATNVEEIENDEKSGSDSDGQMLFW